MKKLEKKIFVLGGVCLAFVVMITTLFLNSYSIQETVKSISITSTKLDYSNKEAGSFKVTKSSEWISSEKVKITMDLDTVSFPNEGEKNLILILDTSNVMDGKINSIKDSMNVLIDTFLVNSNYKMALIDMNEESTILSNLTNNKEKITSKIDGISLRGESRNYYQALKSVETILNKREEETTVIFLTGGYSNKETPNEKVEYGYLKEQYQNLTIYGLSYEMGDSKIVESISDKGYLVTSDNLTKTLISISNFSKKYQELTIKDIVNEHNFDISTITNMKVTEGITTVSGKEINWNLEDFRSGNDASLSFEVSLKEERKEEVGNIETNEEEEIKYEIEGTSETVRSNKTPILGTTYEVIYEGNAPRGCTVENVPVVENHKVYEKVEVSKEVPVCKGYTFEGWRHVTKGVEQISEDTFQMPGSDVILRATWSSFSIAMSLEGEVIEYKKPILQSVGENYTGEIWGYKENIKKIVIQDYMKEIPNAIEVFDISKEKNGGLLAYIVEENGGYTVYIQGDGRIELSPDSSNLFNGFTNLEVIEGLENLDTSKVENMSNMFKGCSSLTNLDVSHFDTSNVTNMSGMFEGCTNITELDVSNFDTSKVTDMNNMFKDCNSLTNLDVSHFDTSNVTDMSGMFEGCTNITELDVSNFDTSKVTDMNNMFKDCNSLTNLDVSGFNTSNVTDMSGMFEGCTNITELDVSHFDTSKVTDMNNMFKDCNNLTNLDVSGFDTSNVTDMSGMFEGCTNITELDVSNFDTSKVTDMNNMFKGCENITNLDISNFDTSNVTDMSGMFQGCTNLESVDLTGIDTSKIKDMSHMFDGCGNLTTITPENIEVPEGTKTDGLFNGCENLPTRPIKVSYSVEITTNEGGRVSTNLLSIDYGSSNTFEVIPNTGYYLSSISCINGYTTNANVGTSQTETQTITISNNNQDSISTCTVEFDTTFVTYLVSLAKTDTTNLAYDTTSDRNLRYIGTSPNNYVRFNNELWRVIGVMNNVADSNGSKASRIKLIRASSIGNLNWHNTIDVVNWPGSSTGILLNSGTYWNRSGSYSSIGLTSDTKTKISAITWNLGGAKNLAECTFTSAEMYMAERGTLVNVGSTTWKGYVGLMYGSDYGYAVGGSARNTCLSAKLGSYSSCYTSNWLYLGSQELIMTANSIAAPYSFLILKGSLNAMGTSYHKYVGATRPVVYLNTNIKRTGGSGTSSDPFTIE